MIKNGNVNILGTDYSVKVIAPDEYMLKNHYVGYCSYNRKEISISDLSNFEYIDDIEKEVQQKETLRHEIIHAFLNESGLQDCSFAFDGAWAKSEEMVDRFAIQSPKIFNAMRSIGCL